MAGNKRWHRHTWTQRPEAAPTLRGALLIALSLIILQLAVASAAKANSTFFWYGEGNSTCWQAGQPPNPSNACDGVGENFLNSSNPPRMIENGVDGTTSGDYCGYHGTGEALIHQDEIDESPWTGIQFPAPYGHWQEGDLHKNTCGASGARWAQEIRGGSFNQECTGQYKPCIMQHYVSLNSQNLGDRPWGEAFAGPLFMISATADAQTATIKGGGWGFLCPLLEDVKNGTILEYCFEEWKVGHEDPGGEAYGFDRIAECSGTPDHLHAFDQVLTDFAPGTKFATEKAGSTNTFSWGGSSPASGTFTAGISTENLLAAIRMDNKPPESDSQGHPKPGSGCGRGHSENLNDYALIGIEDGMEGYSLSELGGHTENLQAYTEFSHYALKPAATTQAATGVTQTEARINGTVNPEGSSTEAWFEYGKTTAYGSRIPSPTGWPVGAGTTNIPAYETLKSLQPGTTYHYRVVGVNANGTTVGEDRTFTTLERAEVYFSDGGDANSLTQWSWDQVEGWKQTLMFGHPLAAGTSPTSVDVNGTPNIFFVDASRGNQLTDWVWSSSSGWQQTFLSTDPVAAGTSPSAVVINNIPAVFFVDAKTSNTITELSGSGSSWAQAPLFGHPVAKGSSPSATVFNGNPQVYFSDAEDANSITQWHWNATEGWKQAFLFGHPVAAGTSPSAIVVNGTSPNVFFSDAEDANSITQWHWSAAEGWAQAPLFGHPVAKGSSPSATVFNGNPQVYFSDAEDANSITQWHWNATEGWKQAFLFGHPVAAGTSPSAIVVNGTSPNVFFSDAEDANSITQWHWSAAEGWVQAPLFGHPVAKGSSPSGL